MKKGIKVAKLKGRGVMEFLEFMDTLGDMTKLSPKQSLEMSCKLISLAVVDEKGEKAYPTIDAVLDNVDFAEIERLAEEIVEVSGLPQRKGEAKNSPKNSLDTNSPKS
jgi:hypothetical protein